MGSWLKQINLQKVVGDILEGKISEGDADESSGIDYVTALHKLTEEVR